MTEKTEDQTKKENADHGVPHPPPHEEEAKGTPNDDRLQSEIPQAGDSKE